MTVGERLLSLIAGPDAALFGVPGGQTLPLYAASGAAGARHLVVRDERNAVTAADAYARLTGTVGVCDATVGPGATNLVSGLAEAHASSIPLIAVVADTRRDAEHLRRHSVASQSFEQSETLAPVTKWVGRVHEPAALDEVVDQALRVATAGRPGPVVVSIPEDIFLGPADVSRSRIIADGDRGFPRHRPHPNPDLIGAVAQLVRAAERPVILAGGGAVFSGSAPALSALAEACLLPVATSLNGKGAIDERHRLSAGVVGGFGSVRGNLVVQAADLIVAIGTKHSQLGTHGWRLPAAGQAVVHIDIDGTEIGRAVPAQIGVVADARSFCVSLAEALAGWKGPSTPWIDTIRPAEDDATDGAGVRPEDVVGALDRMLGAGDVLVCEASLSSGWGARYFRVKRTGPGMLAPRGLAGLGWAPGAALGARLARSGGRVVALTGDGGWGYGLSETETAARYGLAITTVVLNNSSLAWIRHVESRMGMAYSTDFTTVDFAATARAMGAAGFRVEDPAAVEATIAKAIETPGPSVVEVVVSAEATPIIGYGSVRRAAYG
ncbi:MAG: thiamine pyrophosphate-binding protein [Acidimicrobiaceae bacterium]|nr:thiamine pyrophosphate-binding protein [Acidimicrobiaceae bacterium]MCY3642377.1 thiamine pyrophosphate-binding protein [Acidimicrobiaceae bacterium]MDE0494650.1 thiamine pyrophosphate-binding protein [Acidimicrobiaceae bacterium]MDE0666935.1 thiamine pyrophosphate-binding protein [Acidimicrobiaceae bacterium]